jgi:hypothetical protein
MAGVHLQLTIMVDARHSVPIVVVGRCTLPIRLQLVHAPRPQRTVIASLPSRNRY